MHHTDRMATQAAGEATPRAIRSTSVLSREAVEATRRLVKHGKAANRILPRMAQGAHLLLLEPPRSPCRCRAVGTVARHHAKSSTVPSALHRHTQDRGTANQFRASTRALHLDEGTTEPNPITHP
jgi:hypothetical protein